MRLLLPIDRAKGIGLSRCVTIWVVLSELTYLPALFWNLHLEYQVLGKDAPMALPYLHDINLTMMLIVCLPALVISHLREAHLLPQVMSDLVAQGTASWERRNAEKFVSMWQTRYRRWNGGAVIGGLAVGALVAWMNYTFLQENYGKSWQTAYVKKPQINAPGWFFLIVQIGAFWFVLTQQFVRMLVGIGLLAGYAKKAVIRINPLHPDRVGGLKPIARVGMQNQIIVAIVGVNVGSIFVVLQMLGKGASIWIGVIAALAYLIVAPVVFVGPLVPFRPHMLEGKNKYLRRIGDQFRDDLDSTLRQLNDDSSSVVKLEKLERLGGIHERIAKLPEWPLDTRTVRKFSATLLSPVASVVVSWLFKKIVEGI